MRNETATAPTRDLFPQAEVGAVVDVQATISEAIQQLANSTKIALVTVQLHYKKDEKTGLVQTTLVERARQSTAYLLQHIRPLVRKTDLVFLHQHSLYFVLLAANLEGAAIVEERLWEALLWQTHNLSDQDYLRPIATTSGYSAYPDPHSSLSELFEAAGRISRRTGEHAAVSTSTQRTGQENSTQQQSLEELLLLARKLGIPYLSLLPRKPPQSVLQVVNARLAQELRCYPVGRERNILTVAMLNPQDRSALERLRRETGLHIFPVLTHPEALEEALEQLH